MLGASGMVNPDQIRDCLDRGWIVVVPNHRLCPQVTLLDGPMQDCRDLLEWIYEGRLEESLKKQGYSAQYDLSHVFSFGTSSGGHLALSLVSQQCRHKFDHLWLKPGYQGFDVRRPVAGIFDLYAPCNFAAPFWTSTILPIASKLPAELSKDVVKHVQSEFPIPTRGGISLEGQAPGPPDFSEPRQAFAFWHIGNGRMLDVLAPSGDFDKVDPVRNISSKFPPTFIAHGKDDIMVPIDLSQALLAQLQHSGVRCGLVEIPNEGHTFAARMQVGSQTWDLQRRGFDFLESLVNKV